MQRILREALGVSITFGGESHDGWLPVKAATPTPTPTRSMLIDVRIVQDESGYFVTWASQTTRDGGDSWHQTLEEALADAQDWPGIGPNDWTIIHSSN